MSENNITMLQLLKQLHTLSLVLKQNLDAIFSAILANALYLFSINLPEMTLFPLFLSIGDNLKDIQAISAIAAGIVSILVGSKLIWDFYDRYNKKGKYDKEDN